jgi:hypothetical protein
MATKHESRRYIKKSYTESIKINIAMKGWELLNLKRKEDKQL